MVECYLALGILDQAQKAAVILGHNYPGSSWYSDTYALIQDAIPEAVVQSPSPGSGYKGKEKPQGQIGDVSELAKAPVSARKAGVRTRPAG
jgi:hypothetical protein